MTYISEELWRSMRTVKSQGSMEKLSGLLLVSLLGCWWLCWRARRRWITRADCCCLTVCWPTKFWYTWWPVGGSRSCLIFSLADRWEQVCGVQRMRRWRFAGANVRGCCWKSCGGRRSTAGRILRKSSSFVLRVRQEAVSIAIVAHALSNGAIAYGSAEK